MGTRGYIAVRYRGVYYCIYNHWDSYFDGLGALLVELLRLHPDPKLWASLIDTALLIQVEGKEGAPPADLLNKLQLSDQSVLEIQTHPDKWYMLLSHLSRKPSKWFHALETGHLIITQTSVFAPRTTLFIEYTYVIDLDTASFTVNDGSNRLSFNMLNIPVNWIGYMAVRAEWIIAAHGCHPGALYKMMELKLTGYEKVVWDLVLATCFPHLQPGGDSVQALKYIRYVLEEERAVDLFCGNSCYALEMMHLYEIFSGSPPVSPYVNLPRAKLITSSSTTPSSTDYTVEIQPLMVRTERERGGFESLHALVFHAMVQRACLRFMELEVLEPDMAPFVELVKMVLLLADWENVIGFNQESDARRLFSDDLDEEALVCVSSPQLDTALARCWNIVESTSRLPWIVSKDGEQRILLCIKLDTEAGAANAVAMAVDHFEKLNPQVEEIYVCALSVLHVMTIRVRRCADDEHIVVTRSVPLPLVRLMPFRMRNKDKVEFVRDGFECLMSYLRRRRREEEGSVVPISILGHSFNSSSPLTPFSVILRPGNHIMCISWQEGNTEVRAVKAEISGIGELPLDFIHAMNFK